MDPYEDMTPETALALLAWQVELGADTAVSAQPVDRYALPARVPKAQRAPPVAVSSPTPTPTAEIDPVAQAKALSSAATTLGDLQAALASYPHCTLRQGARNLVFADGCAEARLMVIGEAPGREEDRQGLPFVGEAGRLLDRMFGAIDMARDHMDAARAIYITNVLPWRPPQNRDPNPEEVAMLLPFLQRHVELAAPDLIVLMGNHACRAALGRAGITKLRGTWVEAFGRPALPMFHPAYLLRNSHAKREAWADLLTLQERLFP